MPTVWFIRHGESTSNAGEIAFDRGSTVLTALGTEQAQGASLKVTQRPDLIVVTPYIRTHLTAAPTQARYPGVPCETWPLQEYSALAEEKYIGRTWMYRRPDMLALWERNDPHYVDGAGAESFSAFVGRIQEALNRLAARPEKFIVVFAHGYIIQTMRLMLGKPGLSLEELMRSVPFYTQHSPIENCAVIRVEMDARGTRLHEEDFKGLEAGHAFQGD